MGFINRQEQHKPQKKQQAFVMSTMEDVERKTMAASLLWNPQKVHFPSWLLFIASY